MWTVARYLPVAPFSLKPAAATSSGGKTLLVVSPYAIKMALLDVAIRSFGLEAGERWFSQIRDLAVAVALPQDILVFSAFIKIRRPVEFKDSKKPDETRETFEARRRERIAEMIEKGNYPFYSTISFREYVQYRDVLRIAIAAPASSELPTEFASLLMGVNYFGRRGGFVQIMDRPEQVAQLPEGFVELTAQQGSSYYRDGTLQMLDDCGPTLTFQQANIYSDERVTMGKGRVIRHVVLPYRLERSSRSYSWYTHIKIKDKEA